MLVAAWQLLAFNVCDAFGDELLVGNVGAADDDDDWKHFRQLPIVRCTLSPAGPWTNSISLAAALIYV